MQLNLGCPEAYMVCLGHGVLAGYCYQGCREKIRMKGGMEKERGKESVKFLEGTYRSTLTFRPGAQLRAPAGLTFGTPSAFCRNHVAACSLGPATYNCNLKGW